MNIVIYARFSSHSQNEQSIEGQLKCCYEYAQRNGYTVIGEYIDRAISGTTDKRPEFQRMIADSSKKHFKFILVYQLDRFARDRYDSAIYKAKLKKNEVKVLSARENITDDASGVLMESVLEGMAEYYSKELSQKIKRGMSLNAEKCLYTGGSIALGYKVNCDKTFGIDETAAAITVRIFEMYAAGNAICKINEYLNAQQIHTIRGGVFNKNSLSKLLQNKRYIGIFTYNKQETPGGIPRIISDELFNKVQRIMEANKKAPARSKAKEEYILTTKLFCGLCRDMMTGARGTSRNGTAYHYYACNKARIHKCNKKQVSKKWIEDLVIKKCREILTDENIELIASAVVAACEKDKEKTEINRIQKLIKDNQRKQTNLTKAVAECESENVRKTLYLELNNVITASAELEKQILSEEVALISLTKPQIKFFLNEVRKGSADDIKYRKILVTVLVNAIYLYDDKITFILNAADKPVEITETLLNDIEQAAECSYLDSIASPKWYYTNCYYFSGGFAVTFKL